MQVENQDQSFLEVFDNYNQIIYRYIFIRVGRIKETAEDLTQETFVKAFRKFGDFKNNEATVKTWLFVIARNTVIDFFRKNKIKVSTLENDDQIVGEDSQNNELAEFILNKLDLLKDLEKDLIIYKFVYELDEKEISKIINKNYGATRVLIHRTINKLKKLING